MEVDGREDEEEFIGWELWPDQVTATVLWQHNVDPTRFESEQHQTSAT